MNVLETYWASLVSKFSCFRAVRVTRYEVTMSCWTVMKKKMLLVDTWQGLFLCGYQPGFSKLLKLSILFPILIAVLST